VAQAGLPGVVTIATNMAGRGTDIILGGSAEGLTKLLLFKLIYKRLMLGECKFVCVCACIYVCVKVCVGCCACAHVDIACSPCRWGQYQLSSCPLVLTALPAQYFCLSSSQVIFLMYFMQMRKETACPVCPYCLNLAP